MDNFSYSRYRYYEGLFGHFGGYYDVPPPTSPIKRPPRPNSREIRRSGNYY